MGWLSSSLAKAMYSWVDETSYACAYTDFIVFCSLSNQQWHKYITNTLDLRGSVQCQNAYLQTTANCLCRFKQLLCTSGNAKAVSGLIDCKARCTALELNCSASIYCFASDKIILWCPLYSFVHLTVVSKQMYTGETW